jgi:hypothetical protein
MTNGKPAAPKKTSAARKAATPAAAAAVKKPASAKKKPAATQPAPERPAAAVTRTERHALVAQAAYFRAKARGFTAGRELDDWVEAESEVDAKLEKGGG